MVNGRDRYDARVPYVEPRVVQAVASAGYVQNGHDRYADVRRLLALLLESLREHTLAQARRHERRADWAQQAPTRPTLEALAAHRAMLENPHEKLGEPRGHCRRTPTT